MEITGLPYLLPLSKWGFQAFLLYRKVLRSNLHLQSLWDWRIHFFVLNFPSNFHAVRFSDCFPCRCLFLFFFCFCYALLKLNKSTLQITATTLSLRALFLFFGGSPQCQVIYFSTRRKRFAVARWWNAVHWGTHAPRALKRYLGETELPHSMLVDIFVADGSQ